PVADCLGFPGIYYNESKPIATTTTTASTVQAFSKVFRYNEYQLL
ncbi:4868_t:CDS:2, partial [Dentiscutata erythropus]